MLEFEFEFSLTVEALFSLILPFWLEFSAVFEDDVVSVCVFVCNWLDYYVCVLVAPAVVAVFTFSIWVSLALAPNILSLKKKRSPPKSPSNSKHNNTQHHHLQHPYVYLSFFAQILALAPPWLAV